MSTAVWPQPPGTRCDFCMAQAPLVLDIKPAARLIAELDDHRVWVDAEDWGGVC